MAKSEIEMVMITKKESEEAILAVEAIMAIQQVINEWEDLDGDLTSFSVAWRIEGILESLEKELKK